MKFSTMARYIQEIINKDSNTRVDMCLNAKMAGAIELWTTMYKNIPPWLSNTVRSANIPSAIASDVARLVTLELVSEVSGSARGAYLNEQYQKVLTHLRQYVEYGCAKGGVVFKPYVTEEGIQVECIQADGFFPISFNSSGKITDCVFAAQKQIGKNIYTRLERHQFNNGVLEITNRVFRSTNSETIGTETTLDEVPEWSELDYSVTYSGVNKLPFGYFKVPAANTIDDTSPLGVSVYSRAIELIMEADRRYSGICWEYEAKEAAVHISTSLLKYNAERGKFEYPGGRERLYREFDYNQGASDKPFIDTFSPDIRHESLFQGFNNQLKLIEFTCSLAYGTISDPQLIEKTAEEIKTSKQRSYTMVSDTQMALQTALEDLVDAMDFWATIHNLSPIGAYEVSFDWDDSIVVDAEKEREQDRKDVAMGVMSLAEYRAKWYGETLEQAQVNLPEQANVIE